MQDFQRTFIELAQEVGALSFGKFALKSGRTSPYFFNAGKFNSGASLAMLGRCYADKIMDLGIEFDLLFGPAYKGIPLVAATATALSTHYDLDIPYAFNRKEVKAHGEGGMTVGAPLGGKVLILDDVITAGTAIRESLALLKSVEGLSVESVIIGLDRQEKGPGGVSAIEQLASDEALPVHAIIQLNDLIAYLSNNPSFLSTGSQADLLDSLDSYRKEFGTG